MSFLFAISHLPEVKLPEDEDVQPMQRSGMVRAFSHLPQQGQGQGQPAAPRPFAPVHLPSWATEPEPGSEHAADTDSDADRHGSDDTIPWYHPGTRLEDHFPMGPGHHDPDPGIAGPSSKDWGSGHNTDPGIAVPMQDLRDADPATFGKEAAPRGATQPRGRWFEKRPTPGFAPPTGKPEFSDLVYRGQPSAFRDPAAGVGGGRADNPGIAPDLLAAKAGTKPQSSPSLQASPPARPASTTPSPPQTSTQNHASTPVINAVNPGTKSDSENADETPKGMDYALKFVGGSVADTMLNTAVAVFGGPGKYSYNPNPLRRHWHVDGWLPKIDREAYNRLQDGAEMLVFSFAGAYNPKNRAQLAIPAPSWRSGEGPPLSKEEAGRWLQEYHENVKKTGSGDFQIGVNNNVLKSRLINGTLNFDIARQMDDGTMHGKDMFKSMMDFYGPAVKAIQGNWVHDGDNLAKVNALTQSGTPLKSAVQMTWTGMEAARHGFTEVEINHSIGENGRYTDIQVTYRKPGT